MKDFTEQDYHDLDPNLIKILDEKLLVSFKTNTEFGSIILIIAIIGLILNIIRTIYIIWFKDRRRFYEKIKNPQLFTKRIIKHNICNRIDDPELADIVYNELVKGFSQLTDEEIDNLLTYSLKNEEK